MSSVNQTVSTSVEFNFRRTREGKEFDPRILAFYADSTNEQVKKDLAEKKRPTQSLNLDLLTVDGLAAIIVDESRANERNLILRTVNDLIINQARAQVDGDEDSAPVFTQAQFNAQKVTLAAIADLSPADLASAQAFTKEDKNTFFEAYGKLMAVAYSLPEAAIQAWCQNVRRYNQQKNAKPEFIKKLLQRLQDFRILLEKNPADNTDMLIGIANMYEKKLELMLASELTDVLI